MPVQNKSVHSIKVSGFRSLADVRVPLDRLTVLVGPNGSGKSNVLAVLRLLATTIRFDLSTAVEDQGGLERILRADDMTTAVRIEVGATITGYSSPTALDTYILEFRESGFGALAREEEFTFKRNSGRGRRITVAGSTISIGSSTRASQTVLLTNEQTTGLATLPKLAKGSEGIDEFAAFMSSMRVLDPTVTEARVPSRLYRSALAEDASNLADALLRLKELDSQAFRDLQRDVKSCLPGLQRIDFARRGGSSGTVVIQLIEQGLSRAVDLADASFGTVRLLSLLTALYEPDPPQLTAIEEIDHGLHPYALDVLADALRAASERTQLLVATHSPTFVNRLQPSELVICDRDPGTGASIIPATSMAMLETASAESHLGLGEMWYSGAVGGVPA